VEPRPENRNYPRLKAPKEFLVVWKSTGQEFVSRAENIGLGGLFLYTAKPLSVNSVIELVFKLAGGSVHARAAVRRSIPGKGMGVQFVKMLPEDRARLNQFLLQPALAELPTRKSAEAASSPRSAVPVAEVPADPLIFEAELRQCLERSKEATYYQLLGATSESPSNEIKKRYYALAQKFHPDYHMGKNELLGSLKTLMEILTEAYKTLTNDEKRANYDKGLASAGAFNLQRGKTESQKMLDECADRAKQCLGANNFAGSIVWLRKCVHLAPSETKYHAMLARSLGTVAGYQNEAIEHFQKAIDLDPWNTTACLQFAQLYEGMQLPWRARPLYAKVLEINAEHTEARERLRQLDSEEKTKKQSSTVASRLFSKKS
jgi:tetratricopeptide (TPR) repeat protein